ncbi:unnamed protein product [Closterium sp. Yama58-4]|nr:unnamed protein product [Closterium sp. Yama58-4]
MQLWHGNPCRHHLLPFLLAQSPTSNPSSSSSATAVEGKSSPVAAGKELAVSSPRLPLQQQQQQQQQQEQQQQGHHRPANFSLCKHLATRLFIHGHPDTQHTPPAPCPYTRCPFAGGVFVPELRGQFFATENFFYTSEFLKLPATATLAEFAAAGTRHCAQGLPPLPSSARAKHSLGAQGESGGVALGDGTRGGGDGAGSGAAAVGAAVAAAVKLSRKEGLGMKGGAGRKREGKPGEGKGGGGTGGGEEGSGVVVSEEEVKEHGKYCFSASYIVAFLHDALGVSLHDTKVRFTNRVGPHDIDWALGAMLMDVITHRPFPSKPANQGEARTKASDSLRADESIGTIMVLLLVTALFLVVITFISMPTADLNLSSMNLAPVSSVYEDSSDSAASPTWTSPRAVHDFSASWGAEHDGYDYHADHEEGAGFDSAAVPSLIPLPSEEEFDSHLVAVQCAYVDQ